MQKGASCQEKASQRKLGCRRTHVLEQAPKLSNRDLEKHISLAFSCEAGIIFPNWEGLPNSILTLYIKELKSRLNEGLGQGRCLLIPKPRQNPGPELPVVQPVNRLHQKHLYHLPKVFGGKLWVSVKRYQSSIISWLRAKTYYFLHTTGALQTYFFFFF